MLIPASLRLHKRWTSASNDLTDSENQELEMDAGEKVFIDQAGGDRRPNDRVHPVDHRADVLTRKSGSLQDFWCFHWQDWVLQPCLWGNLQQESSLKRWIERQELVQQSRDAKSATRVKWKVIQRERSSGPEARRPWFQASSSTSILSEGTIATRQPERECSWESSNWTGWAAATWCTFNRK